VQDTRPAALKTDFILTFRKDSQKIIDNIELISVKENANYFINIIQEHLKNCKGNGLETYQILNVLVSDLFQENKFFKLSEVLEILKTRFRQEASKWKTKEI